MDNKNQELFEKLKKKKEEAKQLDKEKIEIKSNNDIEKRSIEVNRYYDYEKIPIRNAKNGDKYKANFSLEKETMQKIQHMLMYGNFSLKDNSKIPAIGIDLLYEVYYLLNEKGINIFDENVSSTEIIEKIKELEI